MNVGAHYVDIPVYMQIKGPDRDQAHWIDKEGQRRRFAFVDDKDESEEEVPRGREHEEADLEEQLRRTLANDIRDPILTPSDDQSIVLDTPPRPPSPTADLLDEVDVFGRRRPDTHPLLRVPAALHPESAMRSTSSKTSLAAAPVPTSPSLHSSPSQPNPAFSNDSQPVSQPLSSQPPDSGSPSNSDSSTKPWTIVVRGKGKKKTKAAEMERGRSVEVVKPGSRSTGRARERKGEVEGGVRKYPHSSLTSASTNSSSSRSAGARKYAKIEYKPIPTTNYSLFPPVSLSPSADSSPRSNTSKRVERDQGFRDIVEFLASTNTTHPTYQQVMGICQVNHINPRRPRAPIRVVQSRAVAPLPRTPKGDPPLLARTHHLEESIATLRRDTLIETAAMEVEFEERHEQADARMDALDRRFTTQLKEIDNALHDHLRDAHPSASLTNDVAYLRDRLAALEERRPTTMATNLQLGERMRAVEGKALQAARSDGVLRKKVTALEEAIRLRTGTFSPAHSLSPYFSSSALPNHERSMLTTYYLSITMS